MSDPTSDYMNGYAAGRADRTKEVEDRKWAIGMALVHVGAKASVEHSYAESILSFIRAE
jgi:hypothetical protein